VARSLPGVRDRFPQPREGDFLVGWRKNGPLPEKIELGESRGHCRYPLGAQSRIGRGRDSLPSEGAIQGHAHLLKTRFIASLLLGTSVCWERWGGRIWQSIPDGPGQKTGRLADGSFPIIFSWHEGKKSYSGYCFEGGIALPNAGAGARAGGGDRGQTRGRWAVGGMPRYSPIRVKQTNEETGGGLEGLGEMQGNITERNHNRG